MMKCFINHLSGNCYCKSGVCNSLTVVYSRGLQGPQFLLSWGHSDPKLNLLPSKCFLFIICGNGLDWSKTKGVTQNWLTIYTIYYILYISNQKGHFWPQRTKRRVVIGKVLQGLNECRTHSHGRKNMWKQEIEGQKVVTGQIQSWLTTDVMRRWWLYDRN